MPSKEIDPCNGFHLMDYSQNIRPASRAFLADAEIEELEAIFADGISSASVVEVFVSRGVKLSEATFRKYVQVGLLPRSRRVGTKGKHKGSRGVYPVGTLRQINEIKRMMSLDYTIEEIRQQFAFVGGELEELRRLLDRIMTKLEESLAAKDVDSLATVGGRRLMEEAQRSAQQLVDQLDEAARLIKEQARVARDAV